VQRTPLSVSSPQSRIVVFFSARGIKRYSLAERMMKKILILEDMEDRVTAFQAAAATLPDVELVLWRNATDMIRDLPTHLPSAVLISLDHDLLPVKGAHEDPGTGLDVCEALAKQRPTCPVLLHTANYIKVWSMMNELTDSKWDVHRTPPVGMGEHWIESVWLPQIRRLLETKKKTNG
jgi:hypothetical protein